MLSLTARLLIAGSVVLGAFLGLTGYALDQAYQRSAKESVQERLQGHVLTLIAAAQVRLDGSIYIPEYLPIVGFNQADSGLYAKIINNKSESLWSSTSLGEHDFPVVTLSKNTESRFSLIQGSDGNPLFNYSYGVSWDTINKVHVYTINVVESLEAYNQDIDRFRQLLWMWLGGVSLLLLAVQGLILRWSLSPLHKAADEIVHIEQGKQATIEGTYPKELRALTNNLNALMASNKQHLQRHRHALSDLAHSLKTPLALMCSASERKTSEVSLNKTVTEQVDQMQKIIDYQLQRAATSGHIPLSKPIDVAPIVKKIMNSLTKVYAEKAVKHDVKISEGCLFHGDESDLFEMLGNVLDNAFKWCVSKVSITISIEQDAQQEVYFVMIVEDDGPGVDEPIADSLLERGVRSEKKEGYGIGLAIVKDIVQAYDGILSLDKSSLGGALFVIKLKQTL